MQTMHLFAGIGGGLLADRILGHTPLVAVEWEPYACQVLRERVADGWFPGMHVWEGDVQLFDPSEYTGRVDCIHAGFPCQDISVAGKQAGIAEGTRSGLYREVLRIAGSIRPRYIFLENVAAIVSKGVEEVLKDLAQMGYDTRWLCIRASDVGAPHHRDRWFALADSKNNRNYGREWEPRNDAKQSNERRFKRDRSDWNASSEVMADSERFGQSGSRKHEQSISTEENTDWKADWPEYSGQGDFGWWNLEPDVGRVAHGVPDRVHRLKGLGNAQVPLQAAAAFEILFTS